NGASLGAGKVGQGFVLDGANDFVSIADSPSLRPTNITVEGWFQITPAAGFSQFFAKSLGSGGLESFGAFYSPSDGKLYGNISDLGGYGPFLSFLFTPPLGTWFH